jgi:hypothetical protein
MFATLFFAGITTLRYTLLLTLTHPGMQNEFDEIKEMRLNSNEGKKKSKNASRKHSS